MPRNQGVLVENNFSKGLITEATGLNFPEHAFTELSNCVIQKTGAVSRRKGIDTEIGAVSRNITRDSAAVSFYVWKAVAGKDLEFVVTQYQGKLRFYEAIDGGSLSANVKSFSIDLTAFATSGTFHEENECQFTSGDGKLFVSNKYLEPFYVTYDSDLDTITTTQIDIKIRDFEGVEDSLEINERPPAASLTDAHKYNLYNQGWKATTLQATSGNVENETLDIWQSQRSDWPSNVDIWWTMRNATNEFVPGELASVQDYGNSPAPKGYFILNAFASNRSALSGLAGLTEFTSGNQRPRCIQFFAGRVFYAGVDKTGFNSKIYFSQIIEGEDNIGACYQRLDPTSERLSDLLATDGGVIVITDIGRVIRLGVVGTSLIIFADNGVWAISGSEGTGFKADDYAVSKISSIGALGPSSFVEVEGAIAWWAAEGIYFAANDQTGQLAIKSLTDQTIKTYYDTIPLIAKTYAKGAYNLLTKVVTWTHNIELDSTTDKIERYNYKYMLHFDTTLGAFYPYNISQTDDTTIAINGAVYTQQATYYPSSILSSGINYDFYFGIERRTTYQDWGSLIPQEYDSYGITGYILVGETIKVFDNNYIFVYIENSSTNSSLFIQSVWDFSKKLETYRWSTPQQCYRYSNLNNYGTVIRRLKLRGQGKVVQFKFYSEAGKGFTLAGWGAQMSVNTNV